MEDGLLPKDVLYGELAPGSRPVGRPILRYKDVCKRDMKSTEINPDLWEAAAADRSNWRRVVQTGVERVEARGRGCGTIEGNDKEQEQLPYPRYQQRAYAATVTETATQELDSTATVDAAPIQITDLSGAVHCLSRQCFLLQSGAVSFCADKVSPKYFLREISVFFVSTEIYSQRKQNRDERKMSERFVDAGSVDNFIAEQENKATLQKTQRDVKLLQTFLGTKNELRKVEEIPALKLNENMCE